MKPRLGVEVAALFGSSMLDTRVLGYYAPWLCPVARSHLSPRDVHPVCPVVHRMTPSAGEVGENDREVDVETIAKAREAAKKNDLAWFLEFIGDDDVGQPYESSRLDRTKKRASSQDPATSRGPLLDDRDKPTAQWQRGPNDRGGGEDWRREPSYGAAGMSYTYPGRPPRDRKGVAAADSAYDYDLDDEFTGEKGEGGWGYDTELSAEVVARRRDVEVGRVRERAREAARRRPLIEEEEEEEDADGSVWVAAGTVDGQDEMDKEGLVDDGAESSSLSPEKAKVLTEELGYSTPEAQSICPDMVDLVLERRIHRPASGVPPDWLDGSGDAPGPVSAAGGPRGSRTSGTNAPPLPPSRGGYADGYYSPGADYKDWGGGGARQWRDARRGPEYDDMYDDEYDDLQGWGGQGGPSQSNYDGYGGRGMEGEGERLRGGYRGYRGYGKDSRGYGEDRLRDRGQGGRGGGRMEREGGRGRGGSRTKLGKRKLSPSEKYERRLRGMDMDDLDNNRLWTGVAPEGPWPSLDEFKKMLREETDMRLTLVGPWAAEVVAAENAFRLEAYRKWLNVLDKGVGRTLEEQGFFDAPRSDHEENSGYGGYNDSYGGYSGYGTGSEDRRRPRPRSGGREGAGGGSVVSDFLRGGADGLRAWLEGGPEEDASRFEREYPGRVRVSSSSRAREGYGRERSGAGGRGSDGVPRAGGGSPEVGFVSGRRPPSPPPNGRARTLAEGASWETAGEGEGEGEGLGSAEGYVFEDDEDEGMAGGWGDVGEGGVRYRAQRIRGRGSQD